MSNLEIEQYVLETVTLRSLRIARCRCLMQTFSGCTTRLPRSLTKSGIDQKLARACGQTARVASDVAPDGSTNLERALNVKMLMDI